MLGGKAALPYQFTALQLRLRLPVSPPNNAVLSRSYKHVWSPNRADPRSIKSRISLLADQLEGSALDRDRYNNCYNLSEMTLKRPRYFRSASTLVETLFPI